VALLALFFSALQAHPPFVCVGGNFLFSNLPANNAKLSKLRLVTLCAFFLRAMFDVGAYYQRHFLRWHCPLHVFQVLLYDKQYGADGL